MKKLLSLLLIAPILQAQMVQPRSNKQMDEKTESTRYQRIQQAYLAGGLATALAIPLILHATSKSKKNTTTETPSEKQTVLGLFDGLDKELEAFKTTEQQNEILQSHKINLTSDVITQTARKYDSELTSPEIIMLYLAVTGNLPDDIKVKINRTQLLIVAPELYEALFRLEMEELLEAKKETLASIKTHPKADSSDRLKSLIKEDSMGRLIRRASLANIGEAKDTLEKLRKLHRKNSLSASSLPLVTENTALLKSPVRTVADERRKRRARKKSSTTSLPDTPKKGSDDSN